MCSQNAYAHVHQQNLCMAPDSNLNSYSCKFMCTIPVGYSVDLRWRAVWLHLICGKSRYEIANLLFMSKRSVDRYIYLYQSTGTVQPIKQRHGPPLVLSEFEQISVIQSLVNKPTMYLEELQSELYELTGTWVHVSTICRTVQHLGLTRKKVQRIALQCSEELQLQFIAEISIFDPEMITVLSESFAGEKVMRFVCI